VRKLEAVQTGPNNRPKLPCVITQASPKLSRAGVLRDSGALGMDVLLMLRLSVLFLPQPKQPACIQHKSAQCTLLMHADPPFTRP